MTWTALFSSNKKNSKNCFLIIYDGKNWFFPLKTACSALFYSLPQKNKNHEICFPQPKEESWTFPKWYVTFIYVQSSGHSVHLNFYNLEANLRWKKLSIPNEVLDVPFKTIITQSVFESQKVIIPFYKWHKQYY